MELYANSAVCGCKDAIPAVANWILTTRNIYFSVKRDISSWSHDTDMKNRDWSRFDGKNVHDGHAKNTTAGFFSSKESRVLTHEDVLRLWRRNKDITTRTPSKLDHITNAGGGAALKKIRSFAILIGIALDGGDRVEGKQRKNKERKTVREIFETVYWTGGQALCNKIEVGISFATSQWDICHLKMLDSLSAAVEGDHREEFHHNSFTTLIYPNIPDNLAKLMARDKFRWMGIVPADEDDRNAIFIKTKTAINAASSNRDITSVLLGFTCKKNSREDANRPCNLTIRYVDNADDLALRFELKEEEVNLDFANSLVKDAMLMIVPRN
jgi:hypothetical protein